jgi:DNA-binding response OmpR family regulator
MEGDRERCLVAGMDDYLSKPINPGKIAGMIESVWTRKNGNVPDEPKRQWSPAASSIKRVSSQRSLTEDPRYMS